MPKDKEILKKKIAGSLGKIADLPPKLQTILLEDISEAIDNRLAALTHCIQLAQEVKQK